MIIKIYDFLCEHSLLRRASLLLMTLLLIVSALSLSYKEDISDFLPLSPEERQQMDVYQSISGANKLAILFTSSTVLNPDSAVQAIDYFARLIHQNDTAHMVQDLTTTFDIDKVQAVTDFVYQNIPLFLTAADYHRMDSLLSLPGYMEKQLDQDKEMLLFPSGGLLSSNIARDPLNIFTPTVAKLQSQQQENHFELYDAHIFTPDMSHAIALLSSPFGNAETSRNTQLLSLLNSSIEKMHTHYPTVNAHVLGGPQIAVGNASRIKTDSLLAVSLSVSLILLLLAFTIRSWRNISLIAVSILWGTLFALGLIALFRSSISIIVIGISSVIVGIAVNYPLHIIAHTSHESSIRQCLKDIAEPLLVGNITTVGAFLALVPLNSVALRDLGLFASLLLLGTIFFVIIYLPHMVKPSTTMEPTVTRSMEPLFHHHNWPIVVIVILTCLFGWYSLKVEFDSNLSHINYMTPQQHEDMAYFESLLSPETSNQKPETRNQKPITLYIVSQGKNADAALDAALQKHVPGSVCQFLSSTAEQHHRLQMWHDFLQRHPSLNSRLSTLSQQAGFSPEAFAPFYSILGANYTAHPLAYFAPLISTVFQSNIIHPGTTIVDKLQVDASQLDRMKSLYPGSFNIESLNSSLTNSLSDNFNYIGWACSCIVFFFLWFSFRSIRLAIISFVPMAISWVWILGLMVLMDIHFNIVNIILATFIFGQGDDYTIFITEGCMYEDRMGKPILASYKRSILLSAVIMFLGIGTLIIARHPVLHSLAQITILGMFSVVLMSWIIPPFLYRLLMRPHSHSNKQ